MIAVALPLAACCDDVCERVASVEIWPPTTHADPGVEFQLVAVARDAAGTPLATIPKPKWSGSVTFASKKTNPTVVSAPAANLRDIRVKIGKVESAPAAVIVERDAGSTAIVDRVRLPHPNGARVTGSLLFARVAGGSTDCGNAKPLFYAVARMAVLDHNLTGGCNNSVALFAPGRAALYEKAGSLNNAWDDAANTLTHPSFPDPRRVPLVVWYRVDAPDVDTEVAADVNYASDIFQTTRAGMAFTIQHAEGSGLSRTFSADDPKCTNVESELDFTIEPGIVNVVYVAAIDWFGDLSIRGLTCQRPAGTTPVVIVSWLRKVPSTFAHELAHVMALADPPFDDWRGGHTTFLDEFDQSNLMWSEENATVGLERDHLSLGQAFRLSFDARSWLNVSGIRTGNTEPCQPERETDTPCPHLHWDVR